ncbi:MAG: hypothetical protein Q4Q53_04760 [Methanocorpusculum sp.]|nr:hypothetical protein [Methanocorpusculum sp.]
MADTETQTPPQLKCQGVFELKIDREEAIKIAGKWLGADNIKPRQKDKIRFGKAELVYYPFWRYCREDGGENKIIYRPACGTLLTGLQNMQRSETEIVPIPKDVRLISPTVKSSVYLPDLHGIARGENLIAIPLWVISYKFKNTIYMIEVDGVSGEVFTEWHPIKEPVNWSKTAVYCFIPMLILSLIGIYAAPWLFIIIAATLLVLIYKSQMIGLLSAKRKEGKDGT